jgi:hypothetical protein
MYSVDALGIAALSKAAVTSELAESSGNSVEEFSEAWGCNPAHQYQGSG